MLIPCTNTITIDFVSLKEFEPTLLPHFLLDFKKTSHTFPTNYQGPLCIKILKNTHTRTPCFLTLFE